MLATTGMFYREHPALYEHDYDPTGLVDLRVKFVFSRTILPVVIPSAALITRSAGPRVALLDEQGYGAIAAPAVDE